MPRSSREEVFVREFVMGIGFIGGLFARIGVDPEGEIIKALISAFPSIAQFSILFGLISVVLIISSFLTVYRLGGGLGIFAVILAFGGGYLISSSLIGVILLIFAIRLGLIAPLKTHQSI